MFPARFNNCIMYHINSLRKSSFCGQIYRLFPSVQLFQLHCFLVYVVSNKLGTNIGEIKEHFWVYLYSKDYNCWMQSRNINKRHCLFILSSLVEKNSIVVNKGTSLNLFRTVIHPPYFTCEYKFKHLTLDTWDSIFFSAYLQS